jgi:hypothetical protein
MTEPRFIELGVNKHKYLKIFWELMGRDPADLSTRPQRRIRIARKAQRKEKPVEVSPPVATEAPPLPAYPSPVLEEDKQSDDVANAEEEEESSGGSEEKEATEEENIVEVNREPETFLPRQLSSPKVRSLTLL